MIGLRYILSVFAVFFLTLTPVAALARTSTPDLALAAISHQWAIIKYQDKDKPGRSEAITALNDKIAKINSRGPERLDWLVWQAIILSTKALIVGPSPEALSDVEEARDILLHVEAINPTLSNGIVYTSLGILYYKVPPWPIGFGDKKIAREYLEKGLALNPNGLDANFFMGDFLLEEGETARAKALLQHALVAPAEAGDPVATAGRIAETHKRLNTLAESE